MLTVLQTEAATQLRLDVLESHECAIAGLLPFSHMLEWIRTDAFDRIDVHATQIDWYPVAALEGLSHAFVLRYAPKLHWALLLSTQTVPVTLIEQLDREQPDRLVWHSIASCQPMTTSFIERNLHRMTWSDLSLNPYLTEAFIRRYADQLRWDFLAWHAFTQEHISNTFLVEFQGHIPLELLPEGRLFLVCNRLALSPQTAKRIYWPITNYHTFLEYKFPRDVVYLEDWLLLWVTCFVAP